MYLFICIPTYLCILNFCKHTFCAADSYLNYIIKNIFIYHTHNHSIWEICIYVCIYAKHWLSFSPFVGHSNYASFDKLSVCFDSLYALTIYAIATATRLQ